VTALRKVDLPNRLQEGESWHENLRRPRKRRRCRIPGERKAKRGQIPGRVGIEERPQAVEGRKQFGHWESDTVEGAKGKGLIVTHVERKSRLTLIHLLPDKTAAKLHKATIKMMKDLPKCMLRTMTPDNGKEFSAFKLIEAALGLKVFFANPHSPWERGLNENTNGLLRQWLPKGSDFSQRTHTELAGLQKKLNNRPRKCLNFRTPLEVVNALPGVALQN